MVKHALPDDDVWLDAARRLAGGEIPLLETGQLFDFAGDEAGDIAKRKNRPPIARNDTNGKNAVTEQGRDEPGDAKSTGNVLKNDRDPDHDHLTVKNHRTLHGEFGTLKLSAN